MTDVLSNLTIVTSCCGYGQYLGEWAASITNLTTKPARVVLFTHGSEADERAASEARQLLENAGIEADHAHHVRRLDFGTARNYAVLAAKTEWVQHLDCDDLAMPHMLDDVAALMDSADVIALGYERSGDLAAGPANRRRIYSDTTGQEALDATAPCSGVSPFRRAFWEQSPYRTDMRGAWDTALWIGFAKLGARFRATKRPCFWYRQHRDSIFNRRRKVLDWTHALTEKQLGALRRGYSGVAVLVPRDTSPDADRRAAWEFVRTHYADHHPEWAVIEGFAPAEPWCKGEAVADALMLCTASTLVIADADCIVPPSALSEAVAKVESRSAPWAVPHTLVHRLTSEATVRLAAGIPLDGVRNGSLTLQRPPYLGFAGGGVFVVPRVVYDASGGIPRAFRGWGAEDEAFAVILDCLAGPHWRGSADLVHLWHQPQPSRAIARQVTAKPFAHGNRYQYRQVATAARKGEDALWATLQRLHWTAPPKRGQRSEAEIAERRRRQSFLARRGGL